MKGNLKRFWKLSWKGIPVGIIASVLIGTVVLAAVLITVTQTITQQITEVPDYGSITAGPITLTSVEVGGTVFETRSDAVIVELKTAGKDKYLHMKLDTTTANLYTAYGVSISTDSSSPMGDIVGLQVSFDNPEKSVKLTATGTYTFRETINATAGPNAGSANVKVTYTLEDS